MPTLTDAGWEGLMASLEDQALEVLAADKNMAPYKIFKEGGKFVVKNNAGMVKARFDKRPDAVKYLRALYANVKGAPDAADRKKWSGKQKRAVSEK